MHDLAAARLKTWAWGGRTASACRGLWDEGCSQILPWGAHPTARAAPGLLSAACGLY